MTLLTTYKNGNYSVFIFSDGTKVRVLDENETEFKPEMPESIDVKISEKCSLNCPFCYENANISGKVASLGAIFNFANELKPGIELAIGGGALSEIEREQFFTIITTLSQTYELLPSITVNALELLNEDFFTSISLMARLNFINGLGVSYNKNNNAKKKLLQLKRRFPKKVIVHTIAGITDQDDYQWLMDNNFKVLILGYKDCGRASGMSQFTEEAFNWLEANIFTLKENLKTLSFDCLAVKQLNVKEKVSEEDWNSFYMGDDGEFTMYADLVNMKYAKNSIAPENERIPITTSLKTFFQNINKKL